MSAQLAHVGRDCVERLRQVLYAGHAKQFWHAQSSIPPFEGARCLARLCLRQEHFQAGLRKAPYSAQQTPCVVVIVLYDTQAVKRVERIDGNVIRRCNIPQKSEELRQLQAPTLPIRVHLIYQQNAYCALAGCSRLE
ncbi:MAG: hypothetical protein M3Y72_03670 [Acidobacteriota bacterium]|nr:hypothetical protein [Acidobacteriota bacterium]